MVVVEPKREQSVRDWRVVGQESVAEACAKLAGERRTYQSNPVVLGVVPPQRLAVAAGADAFAHLEEIAHLLEVPSCT